MARDAYPDLKLGTESGFKPSRLRIGGRNVLVVGGILDGGKGTFDNGVLTSQSKVENGIQFGPEVLRALGGRKVFALWLAAVNDEEGHPGWFGMAAGEMRIDDAKAEGFRDSNAFQGKLTDAAQGRTAIWQLKDQERKALAELIGTAPELWRRAARGFRDTLTATIPELLKLNEGGNAGDAGPANEGPPRLDLGAAGGFPPRTLRAYARDITVVGMTVDGAAAVWDNGVIEGKSKLEEGIQFGPEVLRALGGKRCCAVWVAVTRQEDGEPGFFGATVSEFRIDAAKKEGYRDSMAQGMKFNEATRGRVELSRLKPEERQAVGALLKAEAALWENAFENLRNAFE